MTAPVNSADPPIAKPGKRSTGGDLDGVRAAPQAGVADATQRSMARREDTAIGRASTGDGAAASKRSDEDDEDRWRHEPVAPVDEPNPLKSLGRAVGDAVTGSAQAAPVPPKR